MTIKQKQKIWWYKIYLAEQQTYLLWSYSKNIYMDKKSPDKMANRFLVIQNMADNTIIKQTDFLRNKTLYIIY